jgi:hypothetical protein
MPYKPKAYMASQASAKRESRRRVLFVVERGENDENMSVDNFLQGFKTEKGANRSATLRVCYHASLRSHGLFW